MKFRKMIKQNLFLFFFFTYLTSFAQTNANGIRDVQFKHNEKWLLTQNIWSHAKFNIDKSAKAVLDFDALDNWISLSEDKKITISPNGQYFVYGIENVLNNHRLDSVVVQSTVDNWRKSMSPIGGSGFFSADSRQYIFQDEQRLCFLQLGTSETHYENEVSSYKISNKNDWVAWQLMNNDLVLQNLITGKKIHHANATSYNFDYKSSDWFSCQLNNESKDLVVYNLFNGTERKFNSVKSFQFVHNGSYLLLNEENKVFYVNLSEGSIKELWSARNDNSKVRNFTFDKTENHLLLNTGNSLEYIDLNTWVKQTIWTGNVTLSSFAFDVTAEQVVFVLKDSSSSNSIWYWNKKMTGAVIKVNNQTPGISKDLLIQPNVTFTDNGNYIRLTLQSIIPYLKKVATDAIQLDVWSYQELNLQSTQPNLKEIKSYSAVLDIGADKVVFRENQYEKLGMIRGDYALVYKSGSDIYGDRFWEKGFYTDSVWLISLQSGIRRFLCTYRNDLRDGGVNISPNGVYLVYFDAAKKCNYFSYELTTGRLINISRNVPPWQLGITSFNLRIHERPSFGSGVIQWLNNGGKCLVYDNWGDIWLLDLSGKTSAECITSGMGRKNNTTFKVAHTPDDNQSIIGKDSLLLTGFNRNDKRQGFFRKMLGFGREPELLSFDPCFMEGLKNGYNGEFPIKAENSKVWVVKRQSSSNAPNLFVTRDFKNFKQLTFLHPNKNYNWLTAELHSFAQLDGTVSQGVLYKPENFDSSNKYPVIISFYGALSDRLNQYPSAQYIEAPYIFDNPAWMASHGYLVFIPDIYFYQGQWGPSTANTIDGVAKYLFQLPFVDKEHIGSVGHSNSGRYGYYLLTHSHAFAAMSVGAGTTNVINASLSIDYRNESQLLWGEVKSYGSGLGNLWQNKKSWLDQTSVLSANKVVTPLLQFHCKKDGVPVEQAIQMFTALRRLEKPVWWLQYDNGAHHLEGDDARDWTIRYTQFFDHYLKCAPAPRWMTQGIPYKLKGIEAKYELDAAGNCALEKAVGNSEFGAGPVNGKFILHKVDTKRPRGCNICDAWNCQFKRTPAMFEKPISEWKLDADIQLALDKAEKKRHDDNMIGAAERIKENNDKLKGTWKGQPY
jgi:dipeptidyl aminopeptidase/acylaminoacyl peptidase